MRIRCSDLCRQWGGVVLLVLASTVGAAPVLTEADDELISRGQALIDAAAESLPQNRLQAEGNREARELFEMLQHNNPTLKRFQSALPEQSADVPDGERAILLFASLSLGDTGMRDILQVAADNPEVQVVLRGIPEGASLAEGIQLIHNLGRAMAQEGATPNVILNPNLFRQHNIQAVPTLVVIDKSGHGAPVQSRVEGLYDPTWLLREIAHGTTGDRGKQGPTEAISEPDLIEVMKERVAGMDWEQKKQDAVERFWEKQTFTRLTPATKSRTRQIDPRIYISEDIEADDGQKIARKGQIINPLEMRPFTQALVVFDPLVPWQAEAVAAALPAALEASKAQRVMYIATQIDREQGWKGYTALSNRIGAHIYLLKPDLSARFQLAYTPSLITAEGNVFVVRELGPPTDEEEPR